MRAVAFLQTLALTRASTGVACKAMSGSNARRGYAPTADELAQALANHKKSRIPALPGRKNNLRAGVLIPLVWAPRLKAIATLRSSGLALHAGEVCFPGGRPEDSDDGLEATARREAKEELGIVEARVLGELSSVPLFTSEFRLSPYVAELSSAAVLTPSADEVAAVLELDLIEVLARPQIDAVASSFRGIEFLAPIFYAWEADLRSSQIMFGATAYAFLELLQVVAKIIGWSLPPLRKCAVTWESLGIEGHNS